MGFFKLLHVADEKVARVGEGWFFSVKAPLHAIV